MRYEHIELDISTAACDRLRIGVDALINGWAPVFAPTPPGQVRDELLNLANNLRARLQHRDADPHCPKNQVSTEKEWLDL